MTDILLSMHFVQYKNVCRNTITFIHKCIYGDVVLNVLNAQIYQYYSA